MKNANTYIRNSIERNLNRFVPADKIRNSMTEMIFDNWEDTQNGILVVEPINRVFIKWSREQHKRDSRGTVTGLALPINDIITTNAPELPISDGVYRGRRKDGTFTMIAYYDDIMVDIGCEHRNEIKITDPFWIDLRALKYDEYKSPEQKAYEEAKEKETQRATLIVENITLHNEKAALEATINELKAALELANAAKATNTETDTDEDPFI